MMMALVVIGNYYLFSVLDFRRYPTDNAKKGLIIATLNTQGFYL